MIKIHKVGKLGNSKFNAPSLEVIRMNQYRLFVLFPFILISKIIVGVPFHTSRGLETPLRTTECMYI
jgi:hypothetical protein